MVKHYSNVIFANLLSQLADRLKIIKDRKDPLNQISQVTVQMRKSEGHTNSEFFCFFVFFFFFLSNYIYMYTPLLYNMLSIGNTKNKNKRLHVHAHDCCISIASILRDYFQSK